MRLWYARRAVPWAAFWACLALAAGLAGAIQVWERAAWLLLPTVLAAVAAASGFSFDDRAVSVTSVTPRGGRWSRLVRLAVAGLPVLAWGALVATLPAEVPVDTGRWWLIGLAGCLLAAGLGSVAVRARVARPGGQVATVLALLVLVPVVMGPFLRWDPLFPVGDFPDRVLGVWLGLAALGLVLVAVGLRQTAYAASSPARSALARPTTRVP